MAQQIKLKRSAVAGRVPTTSSLDLGEIAVNTADGKLYFQRGDSTIQSFFTTNALITGSLQQSGSDSYFLSNVGIGTDNVDQLLHVSWSGASGGIRLDRAETDTYDLRLLDGGFSVYNVTDLRKEMTFDGSGNVGIGTATPAYALDVNADNIRVGAHTIGIAGSATTGSLAIGQDALGSYSGSYWNTAIGWKALSLVTGGPNDAIGAEAMRYSIDATYNTAIGLAAGYRSQGTQNTFIGQYSGPYYSDVTGGYNTFIGPLVGLFSSGSSQRNTGIGANALYSFTNADSNTALGSTAGFDLTTGGSNTFIGDAAGRGITTGTGNTVIGRISGLSSTLSGVVIIGDGNGNQRIYVDNGGNLGIGTTSPAEKLTVEGNISASGDLYLDGAIFDSSDTSGSLGQVLTSIAGGTAWEDIDTAVLDEVENIYATVKNISGGTLFKGTPVHAVSGSSSGNVNPVIAASASDATTMPATFILNQDINDEAEGQAIIAGHIEGVDTSLFNVGDIVYVGESGGYTNVKPTGSANLIQNLGVVTKVHVSNGSGIIYGSGRSNDIPNLPVGKIWVGSDNYSVTSSVVHLDETNGRMGIGTTSPTSKLHVEGTSLFVGQGTWPMRMENNVSSGQAEMGIWTLTDAYAATKNLYLVATPINNQPVWYFQAGGDGWQNMTLQRYGGRVGIRTLEPSANLTVQGHGTTTGKTFLAQDSNASALFTILDNGNVGIGNTTPQAKLDVSGSAQFHSVDIFKVDPTANPRLRVGRYDAETLNFDVDDQVARIYHKQDETTSSVHKLNLTVDSDSTAGSEINLGFRDNDGSNESTKLIISSSGNVGIGTTSPQKLLDVNGDVRFKRNIYGADGNYIGFFTDGGSAIPVKVASLTVSNTYNDTAPNYGLYVKGDAGIGTTAPNYKLDVSGSGNFTDGLTVTGSILHDGDLTVTGTVTAQEFHTEFVSASIIYQSGSTKFGDTADDIHQFTGSLDVSGSIESFGKLTFTSTTSNSIDSIVNLTLNADSDSNSGDAYRNIIFSNRGSEKARIDADGNVGIGTTTPSYKLTVGDSSGGDGTTAGIAGFYGQHASSPGLLQINYDTDGSGETSVKFGGNGMISARGGIFNFNTSGKDISFAVNNEGNANVSNAALYISSSGDAIFQNNVGIGTTSPSEKLEVVGSVLVEGNSDSRLYLGSNIGQKFSLGTVHDGTYDSMFIEYSALGVPKILTLRGNGNVGIGTTSPSEKLEVNGNVQVTSGSLTLDGPTPLFYLKDSTLGTTHLLNSNNSELQIKGDQAIEIFANNTSSIYIASDGDVGIGTTSPQMPLHVAGKVRVDDDLYIISNDPTIFFADSNGTPDYSINANGGFFRITDSTNNAVRLIVGNTGNVGIGTTTPSVKLHVSDATAPSFRLSRTGTGQIWEQGIDSSGRFQLKEAASEGGTQYTRLQVDDTGEVQFGAYGSGTITGTAAYTLAVDSSGNIIEVDTSNINAGENTDVDTGTEVVDTFSSGSGASAFTNYVVNDGTNYRAGQLMTVWNTAGSIEYTDVSTNSIGDTSEVFIFAAVNGADIEIKATVPSDNWVVRVNSTLL